MCTRLVQEFYIFGKAHYDVTKIFFFNVCSLLPLFFFFTKTQSIRTECLVSWFHSNLSIPTHFSSTHLTSGWKLQVMIQHNTYWDSTWVGHDSSMGYFTINWLINCPEGSFHIYSIGQRSNVLSLLPTSMLLFPSYLLFLFCLIGLYVHYNQTTILHPTYGSFLNKIFENKQ